MRRLRQRRAVSRFTAGLTVIRFAGANRGSAACNPRISPVAFRSRRATTSWSRAAARPAARRRSAPPGSAPRCCWSRRPARSAACRPRDWSTTFGPMGDGERTLVGGFTRELIETMHERGYLGPEVTPEYWITHYNRWIPFDPEALKRLLEEYCVEAGVEIRYFTRVIDADVERAHGQRRDHQQHRGAQVHQGEGLHRLHRRRGARRRLRGRVQGRRARLAVPAGDGVLDLLRHQLGRSRLPHQPRHRCDPREGKGRISAAGQRQRTLHAIPITSSPG